MYFMVYVVYLYMKMKSCLSTFHSCQSAISQTTSCIKAIFVPNEMLMHYVAF